MAIFGRKKDDGPSGPASDAATSGTAPGRDSEIAVPPFRPAIPKDASSMSMPPKPSPAASGLGAPPRPIGAGLPARPARAEGIERRTLVVGRGISLQGTVADAERLEVEGTVESTMIQASELFVAQNGVFKGEVEVEDAVVAGHFDGTLTARNSLIIKTTGKVSGTARSRRLSVEEGGQLSGKMEMLSEAQASAPSSPPRSMPSAEV